MIVASSWQMNLEKHVKNSWSKTTCRKQLVENNSPKTMGRKYNMENSSQAHTFNTAKYGAYFMIQLYYRQIYLTITVK